jgi:hypothetical protein
MDINHIKPFNNQELACVSLMACLGRAYALSNPYHGFHIIKDHVSKKHLIWLT